ncbi:MAG: acyl-[ACP]--phospholipid O-acyltransferase [Gammaproteobacteria bacterium]
MKTLLELFKSQRFLPLFITQFLGSFNDNAFKNALVVLITFQIAQMTGWNAQLLVTLAAGIFILPFFLFSATAGQLADKYEKSRLISAVKLAEIILMILASVGFYLQSISLLMLTLFLIGTQAAFFGPLKYAILPDQLQKDELIAGNGLIEAGTFLSILLGTILGGLLILSSYGGFLISITLILFSIVGWVSSWYIPKTKLYNPDLTINWNLLNETSRLIRYSKERWDIYLCIIGISWFWLIGATFLTEFPVFTKETLHANQQVFTLFLTLFSIGIGLGSIFCNRLLKGKVNATCVPLGALGMAIFTFDLYFTTNHNSFVADSDLVTLGQFLLTLKGWHIGLDILLIAACGGLYTVPLYALLQIRSDKAHRARIIASNNVMNALFMVVAAVVTLLMFQLGFTVNHVFLATAIGNAIFAIYICKLLPDVLLKAIFRTILKTLYRVEVKGLENYRNAGKRVVIIANHTSFIDGILLAAYLPDRLTFAVNTFTAQKWWIKLFLRLVNTHQVDPTNPMALKSVIDLVKQEKKCVIFPEGRLTTTGALMKIYEGPGLIADKARAKLLPIRIQGAQYTPFSRLDGKVQIRWMPKITLTIFPAQTLDVNRELKGRKRRQQISYKLYDLMTEVIFESSPYRQTLFSSLIDAKSTHGRSYEIAEDIERAPVTYQQFITRAFIIGGIIAKTTQPGEMVGILLPNMTSNALTFFGLQAFSRVPAMLNFSTGIRNVVIGCQTAKIKTVYTSRKFIEVSKLSEMVAAIQKVGVKIVYLEDVRAKVKFLDKLKGMVMGLFPRIAYGFVNRNCSELLNHDVPAVVLFTSGSEGTPKGVVLSHTNMQANRFQLCACVDLSVRDVAFNVLPVFHSFGLTAGMLLPLLSGIKVFLYPSPLHYRIIPELVYDVNATLMFGTDTFLTGYAKYAHPYDFYSVRYIFAGAEKLRDETRIAWSQKFGVRVFEGYGVTETSPVLAVNTPMQNKIGTVGRLLPGVKHQIKPVPGIDEGGVLTVWGPNIMHGYLLAENPGVIMPPHDGWYETGDVVSVDDVGYVTIKGRVKRFAKIGGEMVSLAMVEQLIGTLWPDYQHAAISLPDAKKGEQITLVTTYPEATREQITQHIKSNRVAEIAVPKKIVVLDEIPVLGTGKVDYVGLKEMLVRPGLSTRGRELALQG